MMDEKLWIRALMDEGSYVPFVNGRAGVTGGMGLMDGRPVCCVRAGETNDPSGADAALCALTALMADTQDTNAVRRGGEASAAAMREAARALDGELAAALEAGEIKQKIGQFKEKLTDWDGQMSAAGISPGGCADLLAMALLMAFCERDAAEG